MGMATAFSHIGLHVADVERSIAFYRDLRGFKLVVRRESTEAYARAVCGYPDVILQQAILTFPFDIGPPGASMFLELFEYQNITRVAVDTAPANPGTAHFCLCVRNLAAVHADLSAKGVKFISPVQHQTGGVNKGGSVVYARDPDGIIIELLQLVRTPFVLAPNVPG